VPPNATLHIDLELVSWKTVTLIGDNKRILKKVLKEGEGYERPNDGAVVRGERQIAKIFEVPCLKLSVRGNFTDCEVHLNWQ
jgi:hypothetical protein